MANYNCPGQIVISGPKDLLPKAVAALKASGVGKIVVLQVAGAFHSRLMQPAADRFAPVLETVQIRAPRCTVVQNVTGGTEADPVRIRRNLALQITGSVRWEACVNAMLAAGVDALVEFGPGQGLTGFVRRMRKDFPVFGVGTVADLEKAAAELGR